MLNYILCAILMCVVCLGLIYVSLLLDKYFIKNASNDSLIERRDELNRLRQKRNWKHDMDLQYSLDMVEAELQYRGI